jgi:hypothetical protein
VRLLTSRHETCAWDSPTGHRSRWRPRLLRDGRRDPAVRRAAGGVARCGPPETEVAALLPAADCALEWIDTYGDPNGDGSLSIGGPPTAAWSTRAGRTPSTGSTGADGPWPRRPSRSPRCRPMCAAYTARVELADAFGDQARAPALAEAGGGPQRRRSTSGLDAAAAGLRGRPGRGGGPGRRRHLEHGPLSVVRQHQRGQGPGGRPGTCSGHGCGPVSACARWPTTWAPTTR